MTSAATPYDDGDDDLAIIIGVSVAVGVLLVIAVILLSVLFCRVCRRRSAQQFVSHAANFAWEPDDDTVNCTDVTRRPGQSLVVSVYSRGR